MVFTNSFLPSMLTACLRGLPCYHTQADSYTNTRHMMMYQVDSSCPSYESWQFSIGLLGATLILAIGPGLWCALLVLAEKKWDEADSKARLGFLTGAYKDKKRWWEVVVLMRKLAFAIIVALCPQSYAMFTHLLAVLMVLVVAMAFHLKERPYKELGDGAWFSLNFLEGGSLTISNLCLGALLYVASERWERSPAVSMILVLVSVSLLVAFGSLLGCLLTYEGFAKMTGTASGQTNQQDSPVEGQQVDGKGATEGRRTSDSSASPAS